MPPDGSTHAPRRPTRWAVKAGDTVARWVITLGGVGTIVAVCGVFVFLLSVALPLFQAATLGPETRTPLTDTPGDWATDDAAARAWAVSPEIRKSLPNATAVAGDGADVLFGLADGSLRPGRVSVANAKTTLALKDALAAATPSPVVAVDLLARSSGPLSVSLHRDGKCFLHTLTTRENLLTGEMVTEAESTAVPLRLPEGAGVPAWLLLTGGGDNLYAAWPDGRLQRYEVRNPAKARLVEEVRLTDGGRLTALGWLAGRETLLAGDDGGGVGGWFRARVPGADSPDGQRLVRGHNFAATGSPVTAFGASGRTRLFATGHADGGVDLFHATSGRTVIRTSAGRGPVTAVCVGPRDDALLAVTAAELVRWPLEPGHPEASPAALFGPVWYEGYPAPAHVWQTSAATDAYEPKFGFWPLIHGTLKATVYALLFAVPVALLAALYTSEFLRPRVKAVVKPAIELMASLPSVVLGFVGALVLAPVVEERVPAVLLVLLTVPAALLLCGHGWQLLPAGTAARWSWLRLPLMAVAVAGGVAAAWFAGPLAEWLLFGGDVKAWLDGRGGPFGGWFLLLLPASALVAGAGGGRVVGPWLRGKGWSRGQLAAIDLAKFVAGVLLTLVGAAVLAGVLSLAGSDPRGGVFGTYVQRNALVVGLVMGFAVIPLIYTIAEDALSSVPDHLRAASLGCGATPWQTAVRVVVPTATSGLFAAVMIGLGRAAGETMVVLMAAGNTPVLDWNVFNGFRTLSANLAVELPEAAQGSTHYRILYLAALTLFALTFVVNTLAELVRLRFRKKAVQL
jgi:phosphate transport system permease protein